MAKPKSKAPALEEKLRGKPLPPWMKQKPQKKKGKKKGMAPPFGRGPAGK